MVRQEYIKELQFRAHEILKELRGNDNNHIDEFEGILKILWSYILEVSTDKSGQGGQLKKVPTSSNAKGKRSWEDYIIDVLRKIGGRAKSKDVAAAIINANPSMNESTIIATVRHHLSLLHKSNKIGAEKSGIRSEGFVFYIKE